MAPSIDLLQVNKAQVNILYEPEVRTQPATNGPNMVHTQINTS